MKIIWICLGWWVTALLTGFLLCASLAAPRWDRLRAERDELKRALDFVLLKDGGGSCSFDDNGPRVICAMVNGRVLRSELEAGEYLVRGPVLRSEVRSKRSAKALKGS